MTILHGWFYLADLNPRRGTEPGKTRPVLVIQTDLLNSVGHPSTIVLPLTTRTQAEAVPLRVRIPASHHGFDTETDVMIDQIRAIDNRRLCRGDSNAPIKQIAPASEEIMREVQRSLKRLLEFH